MNIGKALFSLSYVFRVLAHFVLIALVVSVIFFPQEKRLLPFLYTFLCVLMFTLIFWLFGRKSAQADMTLREGIFVVAVGWMFLAFLGALPYYFSGAIPSFTDSYFEAMSGFTTVGASILPDIESMGKSLLFWRSLTHFVGGGGIVVLTVAVLPALSKGGKELFSQEASNQIGKKSLPSIRQMAKSIWRVYLLLNVMLIVLLLLGGMNFFESVCHAFGTISTGGFSPLNSSVGTYAGRDGYPMLYFEIVFIVFMFFSGANFILHYAFLQGDFKAYWKNSQFRFMLFIAVTFIVLMALNLTFYNRYDSFLQSLRHSSFSLVSIMTTTGYGTEDFSNWPTLSRILLFFAMFIGGSTGSTAGGMKVIRVQIAIKQAIATAKRTIHPHRIIPIEVDGTVLSQDTLRSINNFLIIYLFSYFVGVMILSVWESDFQTVLTAVVTAMGVGPGTSSLIGPAGNFSSLAVPSKWLLILFMVLGRLEILPVFALLTVGLWKK